MGEFVLRTCGAFQWIVKMFPSLNHNMKAIPFSIGSIAHEGEFELWACGGGISVAYLVKTINGSLNDFLRVSQSIHEI